MARELTFLTHAFNDVTYTYYRYSALHISCPFLVVAALPNKYPTASLTSRKGLSVTLVCFYPLTKLSRWSNASCWLSLTAYSICLQLHLISGSHLLPAN